MESVVHALTSNDLRLVDHRLLWWLLAAQERDEAGVATGIVAPGWRERSAQDLHVSQVAIWKAQTRLRKAGIIEVEKYQRTVRIRGEGFAL